MIFNKFQPVNFKKRWIVEKLDNPKIVMLFID